MVQRSSLTKQQCAFAVACFEEGRGSESVANARRLHSTLGDVPPEEFEASHYADLNSPAHPVLAPA